MAVHSQTRVRVPTTTQVSAPQVTTPMTPSTVIQTALTRRKPTMILCSVPSTRNADDEAVTRGG